MLEDVHSFQRLSAPPLGRRWKTLGKNDTRYRRRRVAGARSHVPSRGVRLSTLVLVPFQRIPALLSTLRAENAC